MKALFLFPALVLAAAPAMAQGIGAGGATVSGEATLLSDYRFRGISRSDEEPALQGGLTLSTADGFYLGGRGTTLNDAGRLGGAQLDFYAGYGVDVGLGAYVDAGMMYFAFPDGDGATDYFEPYASLSYLIGPLEATAGAKYAWEQEALGDEDLLYVFGELAAAVPTTPVTLVAGAGYQDAGVFGNYWIWHLGAQAVFGPISAGIRYVDTDLPALPNQDAGLVLSAGVRF